MRRHKHKSKIPVGILGATGMVGQKYIELLANHPWFEVVMVAASRRSEGKFYEEALEGKRILKQVPPEVSHLKVNCVNQIEQMKEAFLKKMGVKLLFSCFEMSDKDEIRRLEHEYAKAGFAVVSNASANRWTSDVPMLLPEVNHSHLELLNTQRQQREFEEGLIVVKPNCSVQSYLTPMYALEQAGYPLEKAMITTLQAVSGAGYPGMSSLDMIDNAVPYISGEESKSEREPLKILGSIQKGELLTREDLKMSATCTRVPVMDGHLASVSLKFKDKLPEWQDIRQIWDNFSALPQTLDLPTAPRTPITYTEYEDRPQPRLDRDTDKGMTTTVGRLRRCDVLDWKFVGMSHNTIRGAAGGGILNAELLVAHNWVNV